MRRSTFVICFAVLLGGPAYSATFDARRDGEKAAECFATYQTLAEADVRRSGPEGSEAYQRQAAEGLAALKPFTQASEQEMGRQFYRHAALHKFVARRMIERLGPADPVLSELATELSREATACSHIVEGWRLEADAS